MTNASDLKIAVSRSLSKNEKHKTSRINGVDIQQYDEVGMAKYRPEQKNIDTSRGRCAALSQILFSYTLPSFLF